MKTLKSLLVFIVGIAVLYGVLVVVLRFSIERSEERRARRAVQFEPIIDQARQLLDSREDEEGPSTTKIRRKLVAYDLGRGDWADDVVPRGLRVHSPDGPFTICFIRITSDLVGYYDSADEEGVPLRPPSEPPHPLTASLDYERTVAYRQTAQLTFVNWPELQVVGRVTLRGPAPPEKISVGDQRIQKHELAPYSSGWVVQNVRPQIRDTLARLAADNTGD